MSDLQIAGYGFPSFNSTNGVAVDVFFAGCAREPKCEGCHNACLWDFNFGYRKSAEEITSEISEKFKHANTIALMGGEPLHQPHLANLLRMLYNTIRDKSIWLYTSYDISEIPEEICSLVHYVKTGRYEKSLSREGKHLASSNQKLWRKIEEKGNTKFVEATL